MKKILIALCSALLVAGLVGCGSTSTVGNSARDMAEKDGLPAWYNGAGLADGDGKAGWYGVGKSTLTNPVMAEKAARLAAREDLSQRMATGLQSVATQTMSVEDPEAFENQVTGITNNVITGAVQKDFCIDSKRGVTAVLMYMPFDSMLSKFKSAAMNQSDKKMRALLDSLTLESLQGASTGDETE